MKKKDLYKIEGYTGWVKMPKGYSVGFDTIKSSLLYNCFIEPKKYSFFDCSYKINNLPELGYFINYICEFMSLRNNVAMVSTSNYGIVQYPMESTQPRYERDADINSVLTLVYGMSLDKEAEILVYLNHSPQIFYKQKILQNEFFIFPSQYSWSITKNTNNSLNTFIINNFAKNGIKAY